MSELIRILSNKRRLALLFALPLVTVALFLFERMGGEIKDGAKYLADETAEYRQNVTRFAEMSLEEAEADQSEYYRFDGRDQITLRSTKLHVAGYADYLDTVQEQAERMSNSSVFGKNKNTFTYRNIQKTAKDFEKLSGVTPEFGGNRAVEKWIDFKPADAAYLFAVLLLVLAFFEDRRNGLLPLIRSCPAGRKSLVFSRLAVLLVWSAAFTVLIYAGTLAVSLLLYGGTDTLSHAVQSIESFKKCTLRVTIGEWIGLYFLAKLLCGFLLGLIFWFVLSFLSQPQLAWIVIIAILGAEYAAWAFIPPQMALSVFRYVNVFSYVFPSEALGKYNNMNFFGLPVGVLDLLLVLFILLSAALTAGIILVSVKRRPVGNRDILGRLVSVWNRIADAVRSRFPITVMEGYKQLVLSGAALFIAAAVFMAPRLSWLGYSQDASTDFLYLQYLSEAAGPINEETYAYIEKAKENAGEYEGMGDFEAAVTKLEAEAEKRAEAARTGGFEPWLIDQSRIDETFGKDSVSVHRWNAIVASLLVILCAAPLFASEKRFGTEKLLRTAPRGRGRVFRSKYAVMILEVLAVFVIVYTRQMIREVRFVGPEFLRASVLNTDLFSGSRLNISIGTFIVAVFALRLISLIAVGLITAFISSRSKSWEKAAVTAAAVIIVPGMLLYFGSEWAGCISIIPGAAAVCVIAPLASSLAFRISTAVILTLAVVLTAIEYKRYSKSTE